ncbi:hypothetical protein CC78DRAFT_535421 [Lojkania enalia]|uniref:rRNA-processing protein EFG1 n=1 Tax=Lojkania enalia TaxID=147567 RepID=A0A9P4K4G7_9PLEO|nr:hypothetical protein CC78DRAFT_535421 [Didymosphaeria enalia]
MSHKRKATKLPDCNNEIRGRSKKGLPAFNLDGSRHKRGENKWSHTTTNEPMADSTSGLRSRIRDLRRLLEHVDNQPKYQMPADVRIERERELEACEHVLAEKMATAREAEHRRKMISKYHQVRFFDRQRATRTLKRLKRELSTLEDRSKKAELQPKIHDAEVDVNYAQYYPLLKPYSSLYPKSKRETRNSEELGGEEISNPKAKGDTGSPKGDYEIWKAIERAMEEGTLDALRNSEASIAAVEPKCKWSVGTKKGGKKKTRSGVVQQMAKDIKATASRKEDDESDGGFFE